MCVSSMGGFLSALSSLVSSSQPVRVLMVGLDAAGKTTILYKLKLGEVRQLGGCPAAC